MTTMIENRRIKFNNVEAVRYRAVIYDGEDREAFVGAWQDSYWTALDDADAAIQRNVA